MRVWSIHAPHRNDLQRRIFFFHGADLHGAGLRAKQSTNAALLGHVKIIRALARGVPLWNIQRGEIVPLVLHFGTLGHAKTHAPKNIDNVGDGAREHMTATNTRGQTRLGHVNVWPTFSAARGFCKRKLRLQLLLHGVELLAQHWFFFFRRATQRLHHGANSTRCSKPCNAPCLHLRGSCGGGKCCQRFLFVCVNGIKHAQSLAILLPLSLHQNLGRRQLR